jgi:starch-binding outer membrane protein, SusD/RagB family
MRLILYTLLFLFFTSCAELFDPLDDNHRTFDNALKNPAFAEGLLINAYTSLPSRNFSFNEVATDDAVSNDKTNQYLRMATGQWSALYNPMSVWDQSYRAILYLNKFLSIVDNVPWATRNQNINALNVTRMKGEALALRGLFLYNLLEVHGGIDSRNNLSGVPIILDFLESDADFNIPRATFNETLVQIYADFDSALNLLPLDFKNVSNISQIPPALTGVSVDDYNTVMGDFAQQRISGRIVKGLKARAALLAASPAYSEGNNDLYLTAVNYAAELINSIGGLSGLDPNGHKYFTPAEIEKINLGNKIDQKEMLWRGSISLSNSMEKLYFPPSKFGSGRVNPSQNLVDVFPMKNGYPISDAVNSGYSLTDPYLNRDPRLALYILYNGASLGGSVIKTGLGGGVDAKDSVKISTRTGYYLRKLLREDINLDPVSPTTRKHYAVHMRYTELFLIYAEAANEAYGPDGTGSNSFSARDVLLAIRKRAGITQPDNYLLSITSTEEMREIIRNERRIELSFEGFRFNDLRRWKSDLNQAVYGIDFDGSNYSIVNVESRVYQPYMIYGPLPASEVLKYNNLTQNLGW